MIKQIIIIFCMISISTGLVWGITPKGTKASAVQFDGIIEINSLSAKTYAVLFVRYFVSPDYYKASIIWAEPHIGTLNYPIYPPTTIIDSNDKSFSIFNEVNNQYNANYSKPIGKRDVFRYMFGDYPIGDIRFAESETLASRIYTDDLAKLSEPNNNDWQNITIPESSDANSMSREVAGLNIQIKNSRIDALKLLDSKGNLIKNIDYEYSTEKESPFLKKQNIQLAERPFMVGYQSGGRKIIRNGQEQMITEMLSVHHAGSRKCTVDYEQIKIGDKPLSLPVRVAVYTGDGKTILRSSRMMNYKQVILNNNKDANSIKDCASFNEIEKQVREMLLKYWMENPEKIEKDDLTKMRQMQKHFENTSPGNFAGDQLRRINMLLQLDWILGDNKQLPKHYEKYLTILKTNGLEQMLLVGGQQAIETTFRWHHFSAADEFLKIWIENVLSLNNPDAILSFAQNTIKKGRFWETANLLEKSLESSQAWGRKKIYAEFSKCAALFGLYEMLQQPDKIPDGRKKEQANWVLTKTSMDDLIKTLNESITNTRKTFSKIENPDKEIQTLKKQLDKISQKITNPDVTKNDIRKE